MKPILLFVALLMPATVWADAETQQAVKEVQEQMKSPSFHQNAAKQSKEAAAVEKQVKDVSGSPENEQAMYEFAAQILGNMKDNSPEEMRKMLMDAQQNPEAFANSWTPEQKQKLKELSERIPAGQKRNP